MEDVAVELSNIDEKQCVMLHLHVVSRLEICHASAAALKHECDGSDVALGRAPWNVQIDEVRAKLGEDTGIIVSQISQIEANQTAIMHDTKAYQHQHADLETQVVSMFEKLSLQQVDAATVQVQLEDRVVL